LDAFVERIYNEHKPTKQFTETLEAVQSDIEDTLSRSASFQKKYVTEPKEKFGEEFPGYEIWMFGSAVNGLMNKGSDLDLTVLYDDINLDHRQFLREIAAVLHKKGGKVEVDGD